MRDPRVLRVLRDLLDHRRSLCNRLEHRAVPGEAIAVHTADTNARLARAGHLYLRTSHIVPIR